MSVYYAATHLANRSQLLRADGNDPKISPLPAFTGKYSTNLQKHYYGKTATVGMGILFIRGGFDCSVCVVDCADVFLEAQDKPPACSAILSMISRSP